MHNNRKICKFHDVFHYSPSHVKVAESNKVAFEPRGVV